MYYAIAVQASGHILHTGLNCKNKEEVKEELISYFSDDPTMYEAFGYSGEEALIAYMEELTLDELLAHGELELMEQEDEWFIT